MHVRANISNFARMSLQKCRSLVSRGASLSLFKCKKRLDEFLSLFIYLIHWPEKHLGEKMITRQRLAILNDFNGRPHEISIPIKCWKKSVGTCAQRTHYAHWRFWPISNLQKCDLEGPKIGQNLFCQQGEIQPVEVGSHVQPNFPIIILILLREPFKKYRAFHNNC